MRTILEDLRYNKYKQTDTKDHLFSEWPVGRRLHNCSSNATCIDTIHSYECNCDRGFIGDGFVCEPTCYKDCVHGICQ